MVGSVGDLVQRVRGICRFLGKRCPLHENANWAKEKARMPSAPKPGKTNEHQPPSDGVIAERNGVCACFFRVW
jgi:hypothetical protein